MLLVLLIFVLIALIQVPSLVKKKYFRELTAFFIFYLIALILSILLVFDVNLPSPYKAMRYVIEDVLKLKY